MNILVTGICGYVGNALVQHWKEAGARHVFYGIDNLCRDGSETNRLRLKKGGVAVFHGDLRLPSDFENIPAVDWVIDAAANPSVLAGADGKTSSRQLVEHNLIGTLNTLEFCKKYKCGFVLLSTSRVYSIAQLTTVPMGVVDDAFEPKISANWPTGFTAHGVSEEFPTCSPISLYGATKLAAETLALEYGTTFDLPVWINRCGVLGGAGQFGHGEQGIFSYWIHSWIQERPLKYIGFGGKGYQVRDLLHPTDLMVAVEREINMAGQPKAPVLNLAGGVGNSISLAQLSQWCRNRFGIRTLQGQPEGRRFDIPWLVLDCSRATRVLNWRPTRRMESVFDEIAEFAVDHPGWLEMAAPS